MGTLGAVFPYHLPSTPPPGRGAPIGTGVWRGGKGLSPYSKLGVPQLVGILGEVSPYRRPAPLHLKTYLLILTGVWRGEVYSPTPQTRVP